MGKLFRRKEGKKNKGEKADHVQGVPGMQVPSNYEYAPPPPQESYGQQVPQAQVPQAHSSSRGRPVVHQTVTRVPAPAAARSQPQPAQRSSQPRPPPPAVARAPPPASSVPQEPMPSPPAAAPRQQGTAAYQSMTHLPANNADVTREVVKKFIADIWNRGDLDLIPEVCHRSLRFNGSVGMDRVGHEGFARMVQTIRDALSDYHCEIHSMVVEGNKAFVRMRFTGRHTGALLGFEPTGRQVAWMGASEFTIKDGKILKVWELGDVKSLEQQLYPEDEM